MVKIIKALIVVLLVFFLLTTALWFTVPAWLPFAASYFLPTGSKIELSERPHLISNGLTLRDIRFYAESCRLAKLGDIRLQYKQRKFDLSVNEVTVDSGCLSYLSVSNNSESPDGLSLEVLQQQLPLFDINVAQLTISPWQYYAGRLQISNDDNGTSISQFINYSAPTLMLKASLDMHQQLKIAGLNFQLPNGEDRVQLSGDVLVPLNLNQMPPQGQISAKFTTTAFPQPLLFVLNWLEDQGNLSVRAENDDKPLINFPWQASADKISIEGGQWRWPYASVPLAGGLTLNVSDWESDYSSVNLQSRINVITSGSKGKGNLVLTLGPGKLGLVDSQVDFQLTGNASIDRMMVYATIPGTVTGSAVNPTVALRSGSLLRATGNISDDISLQEVRFPLAGIRLTALGVSGRLQAIVNATHRYWGAFKLHLDGKANDFTPDTGLWQWKFWGNGDLPPLNAKWDVAGNGKWQASTIAVDAMSTGFNHLKYAGVTVDKPRLLLIAPAVWDRAKPLYNADWQLSAEKVTLSNGGYLPKPTLTVHVNGTTPEAFRWNGELKAGQIGPIRLTGRWDGERLRGDGWWPKQSLMVFQTLLADELGFKIRGGTIYAQVAFSAAQKQGVEAGGHLVVKDGAMWLKDGELSGLDFIASFRLKDRLWQLGPKEPISLRIARLNNLFDMRNISADLQGTFPFSRRKPLNLRNVALDVLGGHISLSTLILPQQDASILKVENVELSELFTVLKPKQVAMSGKVSGELPLYLNNPDWLIRDGWIENSGSLTLRLDQQLLAAIGEDNMAAGTIIDWLGYMEISRSRGDVNVSNLGLLTMDVQIKGINSTKSKERSVILNYHHEENIFQLWRSLRFGDNLQEWVEQQVSLPRGEKSE